MDNEKDPIEPQIIIHPRLGRPKEDLSSLPENWQEDILLMYSRGAADCEIQAMIHQWRGSFSLDLWKRWLREESEFSETVKMGRIIAEAFYSKLGRENLGNPKFNATVYIWQTRNRFGWCEKPIQELELPEGEQVDYTKLSTEALKELMKAKI